ncbi:MAG: hypothetical protein ACI9LY_001971 [Arenicella sp.]|jgi:hypothetical protein
MAKHTISIAAVNINAPSELVWQVLTDFSAYPDWNPFPVKAESTLVLGEPIVLTIPQGRSGKLMKQTFVLEVCQAPNKIAWRLPKIGHKLLFNAYREQTIVATSETSCAYSTSDTFAGLVAGKIYKAQGKWVEKNFVKMAEALKLRCEKIAADLN